MSFSKNMAQLKWLPYLYVCNASISTMRHFARQCFMSPARLQQYSDQAKPLQSAIGALEKTTDWFSGHVPNWMHLFAIARLNGRRTEGLEIGSWEGLSSFTALRALPGLHLTCVDTWQGSDEHGVTDAEMKAVERRFLANTREFGERRKQVKSASHAYFEKVKRAECFDFIYVDGSHYSDDVLVDGIKAFAMLKVGGMMIFDDFVWDYYRDPRNQTATAVNLFLRLKKGQYRIVSAGYQVAIIKTEANNHLGRS